MKITERFSGVKRSVGALTVLAVTMATVGVVAVGATPTAAANTTARADAPPLCGQTDPLPRLVAYTYILDTGFATADPLHDTTPSPRCPTDDEGNYWTSFLAQGNPTSAFAYPMNRTYLSPFLVRGIYADLLSREPDSGGFSFWTAFLSGTGNFQRFVAEVSASAEYFGHYDGNIANYVNGVYSYFTGGDADSQGLTFWTNYLSGGGARQTLTYALAARPDVIDQYVDIAYEAVLDREETDSSALAYWSNVYRFVGSNLLAVMAALTNSQEYFNDAQQFGQSANAVGHLHSRLLRPAPTD